jgi:hypothetical protein
LKEDSIKQQKMVGTFSMNWIEIRINRLVPQVVKMRKFSDLDVDWKILKWILERYVRTSTILIWLRTGSRGPL